MTSFVLLVAALADAGQPPSPPNRPSNRPVHRGAAAFRRQVEQQHPAVLVVGGLGLQAAVRSVARGRPPPLREIIGQREEAALVSEAPPGFASLVGRAVVLALIFSPPMLLSWLAWLWPFFRNRVWYRMLTASLARAGTAFIKWGQWASCRPDVFPTAMCAALASLHSQAPRHGWRHTEREVREALGAPVDQLFEDFERRPIASGSIAQIHRAVWLNQTVAVKVRHPAVARTSLLCYYTTQGAEPTLDSRLWRYGTRRLDIEAEHLRRFGWNFAAWRDVRFPRVLAASEAVLVESYEAGELVSTYTTDLTLGVSSGSGGADPLSREEAHFVVSRGEDLYLKMLLLDNLMHADLHPGNILLRRARRYGRNSLALLDVGMADAFIGFLNAMGAGDGAAAARFGEVLRGVLALVRDRGVAIDANYMTLVTNVLCLEGMAGTLVPEYNVLDAARPLLDAHRALPRPLFRLAMPLVASLKRVKDRVCR
ncbi:putative ABC1 family protein [Emiliania huxleyi CCMP1516]|uniref:Protein kinase domain-containing protein n=2 Tax=Emiliania huxleyi TaxID=2903 RepID=A0A0D3J0N4_EMIH1|nr:putative ABC1 family protein [Emiliania huxleyi CCMP1516]EOD17069.1 putative ABC1 family protein [Emiliania huxleyi CCMP1516]|eukprot:XP_005769498.1 putative ABC1 family protein [Emiliania huxleyi CCMP1516]